MFTPGTISGTQQGLKNGVRIPFIESIHPSMSQSGGVECLQIPKSLHGWSRKIENHSAIRSLLLHQAVGTEQH